MNKNFIEQEKIDTISNALIFPQRTKYLVDNINKETPNTDFSVLKEWLKELVSNTETEIQNYMILEKN